VWLTPETCAATSLQRAQQAIELKEKELYNAQVKKKLFITKKLIFSSFTVRKLFFSLFTYT
jgi:hypothetical protein